jgi:CBS domain-containing protein
METSMDSKRVRDIMLPLDEYAVVPAETTLREALLALDKAQATLPADRQPHRAVLVIDQNRQIVGKVGQLGFLKALEAKYRIFKDLGTLDRAGVSPERLDAMMDDLQFWQDSISVSCQRASSMKVKHFMTPVTECIDENAPLTEAIHKIVAWQTLSVLVTRQGEVVGILRLSDLFIEIANYIKQSAD